MEKIENDFEKQKSETEHFKAWDKNHRAGKIFGGLIIAGIGVLFLAREMGVWFPSWLFTWQLLLITIGIYTGIKHAFQNIGWLVMILIGTVFLIRDYFFLDYDISNYLWPVVLIIIGLYVMIKPRRPFDRPFRRNRFGARNRTMAQNDSQNMSSTEDEFIEISTVFGSNNKNVISKNFRGGEINCVFAGSEINFMQADISGYVNLEVNQVFGGTRLIIPSNWTVKSELTAVFGNVEDKRPVQRSIQPDVNKVLILRGAAVFGGIEIVCY